MPTTQNISLTAGNTLDEDFTDATIVATSKILFVLFLNTAGHVTKKSVNLDGGGADQIAITADTKYTVKLKAADTLHLPGANVTYKTYKIDANGNPVEHFNGTVTVSAATETPVYIADYAQSYKYTQRFDANAALDVQIPAGAILTDIIVEETEGETMTLNVGVSALGTTVVTAASITANLLAPLTIADGLFSKTSPQTIYVNSEAWGTCTVILTFVWQVFV